MSSPANGPYKSKLFNVLNRQSHRLKDQYKQAVRHVKVAAVWGVQIVLYPVYLLVQTARLTGHRLQQASQNKKLQLQTKKPSPQKTPPPADTPIQRVLSVVNAEVPYQDKGKGGELNFSPIAHHQLNFPNGVVTLSKEEGLQAQLAVREKGNLVNPPVQTQNGVVAQSPRLVIFGVASLLTSRRLVLVTVDNQILDILTTEQRQKLHNRIIWELADYWRFWRRVEASHRQFAGRVQMLPPEKSRILPPVRFFWQVMAWEQSSPVAIAVNLFGESSLVKIGNPIVRRKRAKLRRKTSTRKRQNFIAPIVPTLAIIDRQLAVLEAGELQPVLQLTSDITHRTRGKLQRLQIQMRHRLTKLAPFPQSREIGDAEENDSLRVYALIQAAIDYFFGRRDWKLPWKNRSAQQVGSVDSAELPPNMANQLPAGEEEEDVWLTWKDLFDDIAAPIRGKRQAAAADADTAGKQSPAQLPGETKVKPSLPAQRKVPSVRSIVKVVKRNLNPQQSNLARPPAKSSQLVEHKPATNSIITGQKTSAENVDVPVSTARQPNLPEVIQNNTKPVVAPVPDAAPPEHKPEWIETQATPTGYVKHPLERLLGWLDGAISWIEELFAKIWRWLRRGN